MDYPLAFAIALPTSTFIVTLGSLIGRYINKKPNSSGSISRRDLDGILNKKFEHVVYDGECGAISKGIRNEMQLTREALEKGLSDIRDEIRSAR